MMMNLFSSFDPSTNILSISFNWMSMSLGLLFIPQLYWMILPRSSMLWNMINKVLFKELKILLKNNSVESILLFFSLFSFIMFNNFLGLFPYIFTSTSHLLVSLTLALPLWLSFMMFGWLNKTNYMFAHLVPQNTPPLLMPFMVIIETISNIIRALTLSVRLSANMIAGHLLMTLMSNMGSLLNYSLILLIFSQIFLLILEYAVSIIQSYVFMVLSTLYSSEVN